MSLVVPLYNEESGCKAFAELLTKAFEANKLDYELILVDNGSVDDTGKIIVSLQEHNPRIKLVTVNVNEGFGWGVINGLRAAKGNCIGFMGGDEQVRPEDVVAVYRKLTAENLDFCKVKRIVRHDGLRRQLISGIYNTIFPIFFPTASKDVNGTPKIFTATVLKQIFPTTKDWFLDAELMVKAYKKGFRLGEIEVEFLPRVTGKSNVRLSTIWEFLKNLVYYRFRGFK